MVYKKETTDRKKPEMSCLHRKHVLPWKETGVSAGQKEDRWLWRVREGSVCVCVCVCVCFLAKTDRSRVLFSLVTHRFLESEKYSKQFSQA